MLLTSSWVCLTLLQYVHYIYNLSVLQYQYIFFSRVLDITWSFTFVIPPQVFITMSYVMLNSCITHIQHHRINTIRIILSILTPIPYILSHRNFNTYIVLRTVIIHHLSTSIYYILYHYWNSSHITLTYRGIYNCNVYITLVLYIYIYI